MEDSSLSPGVDADTSAKSNTGNDSRRRLQSPVSSAVSITSLVSPQTARSRGSGGFAHARSCMSLSSLSAEDECGADCAGGTYAVGEYHLSACPICLERFTLTNPAIIVPCEHGFHLQCLESWRMRSAGCPVCLRPLTQDGGRLMEARDARRRRRRRAAAAAHGTAAVGAVVAPEEEDDDDKGAVQRGTSHASDASEGFLTRDAHVGGLAAGAEGETDGAEDAGQSRWSCLGAAWGRLRGWCALR